MVEGVAVSVQERANVAVEEPASAVPPGVDSPVAPVKMDLAPERNRPKHNKKMHRAAPPLSVNHVPLPIIVRPEEHQQDLPPGSLQPP